jgi:hypothetical protein
MKKSIILIICVLINIIAIAQKRKVEKLPKIKIPNLKVAYLGNSHPGIKIGAEFNFRNKNITNKKNKVSSKKSFLTANITTYEHYTFKNNVMLSVEWLRRKTFQNGFFVDGAIGVGFSKGINKEPKTYKKSDDGTTKVIKPKTNYTVVALSGGVGYDLTKKLIIPLKIYAKGGLHSILYHQFPYFMVTAEVGIIAPLTIFKKK